jgi:hypothetical protein
MVTTRGLTTGSSIARSVSLALALALIASCGSDGGLASVDGGPTGADGGPTGGGTCKSVAACGGDLVGQWKITDNCVTGTVDLSTVCAGITATIDLTIIGSGAYNADLTYTQTGTNNGTVHYQFPTACIGTQTCVQVQSNLLSTTSGAQMGMTFSSAVCRSSGGGCACDAVTTSSSANETGTYTKAGGVLSTTHDGKTDTAKYCVEGTIMHQMPPDDPNMPVTGAVVFTKQ